MRTSFALRLKPPAEGSRLHDTLEGILQALSEMKQKLTEIIDVIDVSDVKREVLIFLITAVERDEVEEYFPFDSSHPWGEVLLKAGLKNLAQLASLKGSAAEVAAEILDKIGNTFGGLSDEAPKEVELKQLVEIARILIPSTKATEGLAKGGVGTRKRKGKRE